MLEIIPSTTAMKYMWHIFFLMAHFFNLDFLQNSTANKTLSSTETEGALTRLDAGFGLFLMLDAGFGAAGFGLY